MQQGVKFTDLTSHKHTEVANRLTCLFKYTLTPLDIKNLLSTISFLFKNHSLVVVIYLLIRCNKTAFFLWNAKNTDRNSVNKQNTHTQRPNTQRKITLGMVSTKTRSRWKLKCFRSEPRICLSENQNKEKQLFLKIASSGTFSCNASL